MTITGVDFVTVPTTDIDAAVSSTARCSGSPSSSSGARCRASSSRPATSHRDHGARRAFGQEFRRNGLPIAFQVPDVEAARERAEAEGVEFDGDIIDSGVCHQAFFNDPDGNPLGLHHRYAPEQ